MVRILDQCQVIDTTIEDKANNNFNIEPIRIKENAWIELKGTILKNVTIGKYSILATYAIITKNIPSHEVWVVKPDKFLKKITIQNQT